MMGLYRILAPVLAAFCIGTVISAAAGMMYLLSAGKIDREKMFQIVAVIQDVDLAAMQQKEEAARKPLESEQISLEQVLQKRVEQSLARDMREMALDKALDDLRRLQNDLTIDRRRYNELKESFDNRLQSLEQGAREAGILELQRTLEAIKPKQAKEQILKIIEEAGQSADGSANGNDESLNAVVTILKGMPVDSRKKIIAEFKTADESAKLHDILNRIRRGIPETDIYKQTRDQLDEFKSREK